MNGKWPAITLMELMVVMVITGLLVTAVYAGLSFFGAQQFAVEAQREARLERARLYAQLEQDLFHGQNIASDGHALTLSLEEEEITWRLDNDHVVREDVKDLRYAVRASEFALDTDGLPWRVSLQLDTVYHLPAWVWTLPVQHAYRSQWP